MGRKSILYYIPGCVCVGPQQLNGAREGDGPPADSAGDTSARPLSHSQLLERGDIVGPRCSTPLTTFYLKFNPKWRSFLTNLHKNLRSSEWFVADNTRDAPGCRFYILSCFFISLLYIQRFPLYSWLALILFYFIFTVGSTNSPVYSYFLRDCSSTTKKEDKKFLI